MGKIEEDGLLTIHDLDSVANIRSSWEDHSCCGVKVAWFPEEKFTIIGHYKWAGCRPVYNVLIFALVSAMNILDIFKYVHDQKLLFWLLVSFVTVIVFLSLSYLQVIILGPGYLPFNYSVDPTPPSTWSEWMDLIVTKREQAELARHMPHPPRSVYANSAKRYILRADHYCVWVNSWVGVKNTRSFILMTFWALVYCVFYLGSHFWWAKGAFQHFSIWTVASIVCLLPVFWSLGFALTHFTNSIRNLCINVTQIESTKHRSRHVYNKGLCNNFEEVCGSRWLVLLWCIPICVLKPKSDGIYQPIL